MIITTNVYKVSSGQMRTTFRVGRVGSMKGGGGHIDRVGWDNGIHETFEQCADEVVTKLQSQYQQAGCYHNQCL